MPSVAALMVGTPLPEQYSCCVLVIVGAATSVGQEQFGESIAKLPVQEPSVTVRVVLVTATGIPLMVKLPPPLLVIVPVQVFLRVLHFLPVGNIPSLLTLHSSSTDAALAKSS